MKNIKEAIVSSHQHGDEQKLLITVSVNLISERCFISIAICQSEWFCVSGTDIGVQSMISIQLNN